MSFTDEDLKIQARQLEDLKEELSRLNSQFEAQMKAAGVTEADLKAVDLNGLSPELRKAFDEAAAQAKREGEARASQARPEKPASARPAGQRPGAVKL